MGARFCRTASVRLDPGHEKGLAVHQSRDIVQLRGTVAKEERAWIRYIYIHESITQLAKASSDLTREGVAFIEKALTFV
jgi:hypothetical protein